MFTNLSDGAKGAWCMIVSTLLLTIQDAITKWLTADFHAGEVLFYRGIFTFLPIVFLVAWAGNWRILISRDLTGTLVRAALGAATSIFVILSFVYLPLATALAIIFLNPIILTAMSVPLLGERVGWRRWIAVLVGFAGVLIMVRPSGDGVPFFYIFPLVTALLASLRDVATRRLRGTDNSTSILFYSMLVAVLAGGASLPILDGHWPGLFDWGLFAAAGVLAAIAHLLIIQALLLAPAGTVAPLRYLSLVWAVVIGYGVWGDVPDQWKLAGATLVVGAGLFILHRELRKP
ncbi:MAG: DMT family transporter [Alphaproteobacteria bacterium]|jgi:drug/metabolite transporter (DMT)-like permease|nr:DMT family transporter [Alphaproteobacteria bacterium]